MHGHMHESNRLKRRNADVIIYFMEFELFYRIVHCVVRVY
jgi:hypothetical protein